MKETLAYLAGFFDGEGSVSIGRTCGEHVKVASQALKINATNTDPRPIQRLHACLGGSFRTAQPKGKPKNGGEYSQQYIWTANGPTAANALRAMLPCLLVKRERADLAIAFEELRQEHFRLYSTQRHPDEAWQAREALRDRLLEMNRRKCEHNRGPRGRAVGRVNRSLRAQRVDNVVSFKRQEAV